MDYDHQQGDECAIRPSRSLMNVLEGSVGLITVPQAQLPKDGMTDLLVTKLQNLSVDVLVESTLASDKLKSLGIKATCPSWRQGSRMSVRNCAQVSVDRSASPCQVVRLGGTTGRGHSHHCLG